MGIVKSKGDESLISFHSDQHHWLENRISLGTLVMEILYAQRDDLS